MGKILKHNPIKGKLIQYLHKTIDTKTHTPIIKTRIR